MKSMRLRVAIAGAGFGAAVHAPAVQMAGSQIAAICDGGSGRAQDAATAIGCRAFSSWRQMLDWGEFDAIAIALPPDQQRDAVIASLESGRHVLCEKPFGLDLEQATQMEGARARSGLVGAIGYQFRFEPAFREMRRLVSDGAVGTVWRIDVTWLTGGRADPSRGDGFQHDAARGGGVIGGFLVHVIDYLRWLTGEPARVIAGEQRILVPVRGAATATPFTVTSEDSVDVILHLGSALASARVSNCQPHGPGHRIEIFGDRGWLVCHLRPPYGHKDIEIAVTNAAGRAVAHVAQEPSVADSRIPSVARMWRAFGDAVAGTAATDLALFADGVAVRRSVAEMNAVTHWHGKAA